MKRSCHFLFLAGLLRRSVGYLLLLLLLTAPLRGRAGTPVRALVGSFPHPTMGATTLIGTAVTVCHALRWPVLAATANAADVAGLAMPHDLADGRRVVHAGAIALRPTVA